MRPGAHLDASIVIAVTIIAAGPAHAQLVALAADPVLLDHWPHVRSWPRMDETRAAAVLMLFGPRSGRPAAPSVAEPGGARPEHLDVLLLRRADTLNSHAGQVAFPGGRLEPGEGAIAAALREAEEETGLDPAGVDVLGALAPLPAPVSSHTVTPVLAWWRDPSPVGVVDPAESAHVFRAPVADLLDPANRYATTRTRNGLTWSGVAWRLQVDGVDHLVWGFTAGILDTMLARLGWAQPWDETRVIAL
jgi:8-oxo-dGTP pyrophosphatase MutT (NUDIX family)